MLYRVPSLFFCAAFFLFISARGLPQEKRPAPTLMRDLEARQREELQRQIEAKRTEVLDKTFKEYDITASKSGIEAVVKKKLLSVNGKETFTQADVDHQNYLIGALQELITIRRLDPQRAEMVYEKKYSTLFGKAAWESAKTQYQGETQYKALLRMPKVSAEGILQVYRRLAIQEIKERELEKILRKEGDIKPGEDLGIWVDRQPAVKKLKEQLPEAKRELSAAPPRPSQGKTSGKAEKAVKTVKKK